MKPLWKVINIYTYTYMYTYTYIYTYSCTYTYTYTSTYAYTHVHMRLRLRVRGGGRGEGGRGVVLGGSVGRWVGEYVLVRVCIVLVFVSLCWCFLKIPETEQPYQVKRMIGGLRNVLFSINSHTSNG